MKHLKLLKKLTAKSAHRQYHHAAVIGKGKVVFAVGVNKGFHHAEINAIVAAGAACKGATLFTLMLRASDNSVGNGSPCPECMEAIKQAKLRRVVVYLP